MNLPSKTASRELQKLGQHIVIARKRRAITQKQLAEAAGLTIPTVSKLEKGCPGVSIGAMAMIFLALGEISRLGELLAPENDDIGMVIAINSLPQRVRRNKSAVTSNLGDNQSERSHGPYISF